MKNSRDFFIPLFVVLLFMSIALYVIYHSQQRSRPAEPAPSTPNEIQASPALDERKWFGQRVEVSSLQQDLEAERTKNAGLREELDRVRRELAACYAQLEALQAAQAGDNLFEQFAAAWPEHDAEQVQLRLFEIDLIAEQPEAADLDSLRSVDASLLEPLVREIREAELRFREDIRNLKHHYEGEALEVERSFRTVVYQDEMLRFASRLMQVGVGQAALDRFRRNHLLR